MSLLRRRSTRLSLSLVAVSAAATMLATTALTAPAAAHGAVIDPATRAYGCWERWGGDHLNPRMATEDPMCWQAWQANPSAMWNWNGLYRDNVGGNHQAVVPDGQLCSGGRTEGGRYNAMDAIGAWRATEIANNFRIRLHDQASHGADYIRVYVTKQGFNPLTQPLGWGDLELTGQIGYTPASQWERVPSGVAINVPASAPGRTGRHIVFTIWQASHMDQVYYLCSDVVFPGGTPDPTTPPTTAPPTTAPPTTAPPTTAPPTTAPPAAGACAAVLRHTNQWAGGFQSEVVVTAGNAPIRGWTVTWTWAGGQQIANAWNATVTSSGANVTARNVDYNGNLAANASTSFGFLGSGGADSVPTLTCTAS
jgi:predicted carbohydrate-binding protein with CBM5 and CBM33 domain